MFNLGAQNNSFRLKQVDVANATTSSKLVSHTGKFSILFTFCTSIIYSVTPSQFEAWLAGKRLKDADPVEAAGGNIDSGI